MRVSLERLKEILSYDQSTGVFIRLKDQMNRASLIGREAGSISKASRENGGGYRSMQIDGKRYYAQVVSQFEEPAR